MSARAAIVVTGTEVLSGRVSDRNGPWLAERLAELGVELAHVTIVGDRPADMLSALDWCASLGVSLIVTSGGLGPTADDLTATVVGGFCGREMVLDAALEERIAAILRASRVRWAHLSEEAIRAANRKQAIIPAGASILEPVGTAPGLVVPAADGREGPTVVVLPGPPRELQALWARAIETDAFAEATREATVYEQRVLRLFGLPESEIATTLREAERSGVALEQIEVSTCVRGGELEIVTRYEPHSAPVAAALEAVIRERHAEQIFSDDGTGIDEQVAALLVEQRLSVAVAESCTGGLLLARLTDRPGASAFVRGGIVAYSDEVKRRQAGVPAELIEEHGAVSEAVAAALADGARERLCADVGIGVTGIAGPDGGTPEKPVGLVWIAVCGPGGRRLVRRTDHRGTRADVRERSVVAAMHLLRRLLQGAGDPPAA
ncbi:MAG: competence/damage-inducible protein A [Solirubrobacteraceae bacterium]